MKMQVSIIKGFSLIELITVMVLISILGVVALGRMTGLSGYEVRGFFDDTVAALRYAQKLAISTGCDVQVALTSTSYQLLQQDSCSAGGFIRNVVKPIDRNSPYTNTAPAGITISSTPSTAAIIFSPQSVVSGIASDTTFTIDSYQFELYQNTGLINVPVP